MILLLIYTRIFEILSFGISPAKVTSPTLALSESYPPIEVGKVESITLIRMLRRGIMADSNVDLRVLLRCGILLGCTVKFKD